MSDPKKPEQNDQPSTKDKSMTDTSTPAWIKNAARIDRPDINRWYKAEDGAIDGTMIWKGRQEQHQTGETYPVYAVREASSGITFGLSGVGLRDLRTVKVGSKVFIRPIGKKQLDNGRAFDQYEIFAEQQEPPSEPTKGAGRSEPGQGSPAPAASEEIPL